jgi:hypothetical protein
MNDEQPLADIVQILTVDHGCHAVILYGSRARGDFQPTSDWDVAGIRATGATAPLRVARAFHGTWLDAFVYAEATFTVIDPDCAFCPHASCSTSAASRRRSSSASTRSIRRDCRRCPKAKTKWCASGTRRWSRASPAAIWSQSTAGSNCSSKRWRTISSCADSGIADPRRGCHGWRGTTPRRTQRSLARSRRTRRWKIYVRSFSAFSPCSDGRESRCALRVGQRMTGLGLAHV